MTRKEFSLLGVGMKAAYPASRMLETDGEMELWYRMLRDIPYEVAENAVAEHVCTCAFPPSIAEIRGLCADRMGPPIPGFDEAWGSVQRAISAYGAQRPEEALGTLDGLTRSVVENLGWTRLCLGESPAADRANFREAYEARAAKARRERQLPAPVARRRAELSARDAPAPAGDEPEPAAGPPDAAPPANWATGERLEARLSRLREARDALLGRGAGSGEGEIGDAEG